jgi:AraC family transcriptional regulator
MQTITIEETVARRFRLAKAPTLLVEPEGVSPRAFSRLRDEGPFRGRTMAVPPEEAFEVQVALAPMSSGEIWVNGNYTKLREVSPGDTFVFDLSTNPNGNLRPPYDFLRFYFPVAALDQLACRRGLRRVGSLRTTSLGIQDPVMQGLALSILPMFQEPSTATALLLETIALAFHAHIIHRYGDGLGSETSVSTGLAPWQLRRAGAFIDAHLCGDPSVSDLARECRLSASHFARAFRQSSGMAPHRWIMRRRIERAKELLLEGELDLVQVALTCGFFDQSHFTRTFGRSEGHSPGKWRRLRRN